MLRNASARLWRPIQLRLIRWKSDHKKINYDDIPPPSAALLEEQKAFNDEMEAIFGEPLAPAALDRAETTGGITSGGITEHGRAWEDAEEVFKQEWSAIEGRSEVDSETVRIPRNAALMQKLRNEPRDDDSGPSTTTVVPTASPPSDGPPSSTGSELQVIYAKLNEVEGAVAMMDELGVEAASDLRFLDGTDAKALAATMKKIPGAKLLRLLGFPPA